MQMTFNLRDISLTSLSQISDCELDEIISPAQQRQWLASSNPQIAICERINDPRLRFRTKDRCAQLLNNKDFIINILPVMQKYVKLCIPEPFKTEITFWGCSCLPIYNPLKIIYSRINLRFQEVFTAYHDVDSQTNIVCWHVARSPFTKVHLDEIYKIGDIELDGHKYPSGGEDQFRICAYDLKTALNLLDDPIFVYAAKKFNLARMRSGAQPYSRFHAPKLADELLSPYYSII